MSIFFTAASNFFQNIAGDVVSQRKSFSLRAVASDFVAFYQLNYTLLELLSEIEGSDSILMLVSPPCCSMSLNSLDEYTWLCLGDSSTCLRQTN